jgi:hypothetical protein
MPICMQPPRALAKPTQSQAKASQSGRGDCSSLRDFLSDSVPSVAMDEHSNGDFSRHQARQEDVADRMGGADQAIFAVDVGDHASH